MIKTYIKPETKIVKVDSQHIMAGSIPQQSGEATEWGARSFSFEEEEISEE